MSVNKATLAKYVEGSIEYIYPKTTSDLVQYNSNNTVKDILDNLDSTYLTISNASTNYLKKTDISSWAKSSTKPTYTASEVGALASNGNAVSATKDGNGNNIVNTYLTKTDASSKYVTTTNGTVFGSLNVISDDYDNANLFIRSLSGGYSNIFIGNHDDARYCSIMLDSSNTFSLKCNTKYIIIANDSHTVFYGNATSVTSATKDGDGNTISTTYLKKTDITQSDVMGSILVNGEYIEVYDDSEIYAELDSTYLKKTDASSTYLTKTDASNTYLTKTGTAAKATADGSGNTITSTYLKLSGGTLSGDLTFASGAQRRITWTTLAGDRTIVLRQTGGATSEILSFIADGNAANFIMQMNAVTRQLALYTNPSISSDRRIKCDITQLNSSYRNLFDKLKAVSYKYKDNPEKEHMGFVAQDIQDALASEQIENSALISEGDDGMLGVSYTELIALIVQEMQDIKIKMMNI